eukprot:4929022-Amphidinium_carterae.3
MHMRSYSIPELPESQRGHKALLWFMAAAVSSHGKVEGNAKSARCPLGRPPQKGDVGFRLGVEPITIATSDRQIPPYMDSPHHYVNYYVNMYPNTDDSQVNQKIKSYCERRTPYSDY